MFVTCQPGIHECCCLLLSPVTILVSSSCTFAKCPSPKNAFSRKRSKGSRLTLGGLRVEGVFARSCVYVQDGSQPSAAWPCLWQVLQKRSPLEVSNVGGFKRRITSFRVTSVTLFGVPTSLITITLSGLRYLCGGKGKIAWRALLFVRCAETRRKPRRKHRAFEF